MANESGQVELTSMYSPCLPAQHQGLLPHKLCEKEHIGEGFIQDTLT